MLVVETIRKIRLSVKRDGNPDSRDAVPLERRDGPRRAGSSTGPDIITKSSAVVC